jgi:hypothetical protein
MANKGNQRLRNLRPLLIPIRSKRCNGAQLVHFAVGA